MDVDRIAGMLPRAEQQALWRLEAARPRLEVQARLLLEIQRRGLRPSRVVYRRWWRRKFQEVVMTSRELDFILKAEFLYEITDTLNAPSPLLQMFDESMVIWDT